MRPGDLYMHSDYGGAASTVIKRQRKDIPVPRNTLE
jgi:predicted ribosome quality control (RQC) complex YloA/Tae2 family protein